MLQHSDVTGRDFYDEEAVYYRNVIQSAWMLSHPDCVLLDIFTDSKGKIVFVFPKELHKNLIGEWANRKHDTKDYNN